MKTERRAVARYRAKLPLQIEMNDYCFDAMTTEVSLHGLRVLCEGPLSNKMFNQYIQVTPGENIGANIQIKVPSPSGTANNVACDARLISVNRVAQSSYIAGFKIIELLSQSLEYWQEYIATQR